MALAGAGAGGRRSSRSGGNRSAMGGFRYNRAVAKRFTLLDDAYYEALLRVTTALELSELPFCLVGGGAVQAWIACLRTGNGERRLSEEPVLSASLRGTRDLDFATRTDGAAMLVLLNELAAGAGAGPGAHVLGARSLRLGRIAVSFTLEPDDLSGMSSLYDVFIDSRRPLRLRRGTRPDEVPTIGLEELLVTKLTRRGDKAKDILDLTQLLAALRDAQRSVDFARVRDLVGNRPDALALLDELASQVHGDP